MALPSWSHALKKGDIIIKKENGLKYEIKERIQIASYFTPDSLPYAIPAYIYTVREKDSDGFYTINLSDDLLEEEYAPEKYRDTPLYKLLKEGG